MNAAITINTKAIGPKITTPPIANPPVVKKSTINPKNETVMAMTPYMLNHPKVIIARKKEKIVPTPNPSKMTPRAEPPKIIIHVVFHGRTMSN